MKIQSLSVVVPNKECMNKCPFCVARMVNSNIYENRMSINHPHYDINVREYLKRLKFVADNGCQTIILTGTSEPQQNKQFLATFALLHQQIGNPFTNIEMQTTGMLLDGNRDYIPRFYEPGAFGAIRKFDIHEGVDIYTHDCSDVFAVEDGVVTAIYEFTGKKADCDWWNETWCVKVEGKSGVVTYGELQEPWNIKVGDKVNAGGLIGRVTPVLRPEKYRPDIRNHSVAMLHLELRTETCHLDGWKLDGERDKRLLDPTPYLKSKDLIIT